jgi:hypothetical protein
MGAIPGQGMNPGTTFWSGMVRREILRRPNLPRVEAGAYETPDPLLSLFASRHSAVRADEERRAVPARSDARAQLPGPGWNEGQFLS